MMVYLHLSLVVWAMVLQDPEKLCPSKSFLAGERMAVPQPSSHVVVHPAFVWTPFPSYLGQRAKMSDAGSTTDLR